MIIPLIIAGASAGTAAYSARQARKQAKGAQEEQDRLAAEERKRAGQAGLSITAAGEKAAGEITAAGQPTAEEIARRERYAGKAATPGETLMTQAGPISQAVARRVQERVEQPGMEFDVNAPAYAEQIGAPLWRGLKARGIAPRPGTEGGLGTSQFMKSALPAMATLRAEQVGRDITRGEEYGAEARKEEQYYGGVENILAEAIRSRLYESGIVAAKAKQAGVTGGETTALAGRALPFQSLTDLAKSRWESAGKREETSSDVFGDVIMQLLTAIPTKGTTTDAGAYSDLTSIRSQVQTQTPYQRALQSRTSPYQEKYSWAR
jgi:hypothetical protein